MRSLTSRLLYVIATLVLSLAVSGCTGTWTGKGKEVASAIEKTSGVKTAKYSGSVEMKVSGLPAQSAAQDTYVVTFSGVVDGSDPANPRMVMKITSSEPGASGKVVMPGNGMAYGTKNGTTYSFPVEQKPEDYAVETDRTMTALGASVGGFRDSQPMTNMKGEQVPAIYAKVDRNGLCGPVIDSLGNSFKSSAQDADFSKSVGADPAQGISGICKALVKKDPSVWFGISDGMLSDVAIRADLVSPMGVVISLTVQFHQYDLGKRVRKIQIPTNTTALSSEAEFDKIK